MLLLDIRTCRLDGTAYGLDDSFQIVVCYSSGTEDVSVGKVLGGQITDGETRENDLGTSLDDGVQFSVNDLPFGVDDGLVFLASPG